MLRIRQVALLALALVVGFSAPSKCLARRLNGASSAETSILHLFVAHHAGYHTDMTGACVDAKFVQTHVHLLH